MQGRIDGFFTRTETNNDSRDECEVCAAKGERLITIEIQGYHYGEDTEDFTISSVSSVMCSRCLRELGNFIVAAADGNLASRTLGMAAVEKSA